MGNFTRYIQKWNAGPSLRDGGSSRLDIDLGDESFLLGFGEVLVKS